MYAKLPKGRRLFLLGMVLHTMFSTIFSEVAGQIVLIYPPEFSISSSRRKMNSQNLYIDI